jgi:hypothetical protein
MIVMPTWAAPIHSRLTYLHRTEPSPADHDRLVRRVGGSGSPIVTTTDGRSDPVVWTLGAEGDGRLHGLRGDTGEPLFTGPTRPMSDLHRFQTLIATKDRLYVAADGNVYAFAF